MIKKKSDFIKPQIILVAFLIAMVGMIGFALINREAFIALLSHPAISKHARFLHIAAASLFFGNAVVGMLWEKQSLSSGSKEVILHTYRSVARLDSSFSSPLIILTLVGGLSLSFRIGDLWQIGWLSVSFLLFLFSGFLWIISDIPTQYKVKRLISELKTEDHSLPDELIRLLKLRWWISLGGIVPLIIVFLLMVYQPDIKAVADWF